MPLAGGWAYVAVVIRSRGRGGRRGQVAGGAERAIAGWPWV